MATSVSSGAPVGEPKSCNGRKLVLDDVDLDTLDDMSRRLRLEALEAAQEEPEMATLLSNTVLAPGVCMGVIEIMDMLLVSRRVLRQDSLTLFVDSPRLGTDVNRLSLKNPTIRLHFGPQACGHSKTRLHVQLPIVCC